MEKNDNLLAALGELAREGRREEKERLEGRWRDLVEGRLSAEELRALEQRAAGSPQLARELEAFKPLGAPFQARLLEEAAAQLPVPPDAKAQRTTSALRRWWWLAVPATAAAAAVLLFALPERGVAPLPAYSLSVSRGIQQERHPAPSAVAGVPRFGPGAVLEILLRPEVPVAGGVDSELALIGEGTVQALHLPAERDPQGAILLRGMLGESVQIPPGRWSICAALTRPGARPPPLPRDFIPAADVSAPAGWMCTPIQVEPSTPG